MSFVYIGVDPGARWCGIAARSAATDRLFGYAVLDRNDPTTGFPQSRDEWCERIHHNVRAATDYAEESGYSIAVGVEDYNTPTVELGRVTPDSIVETVWTVAVLHAMCQRSWTSYRLVPPNRHGDGPINTYPEVLRGGRNSPIKPAASAKHARSAWDVTFAAEALMPSVTLSAR